MTARGYEGRTLEVNSVLFGVPQSRFRWYAVFVRTVANPLFEFKDRPIGDIFNTFGEIVALCMREPNCASEFLLKDADPAVEKELARVQNSHDNRVASGLAAGATYRDNHRQLFAKRNLRVGHNGAWESSQASPWFDVLSRQQQEILALSQHDVSTKVMLRHLHRSAGRGISTSKIFDGDRDLHADDFSAKSGLARLVFPTQVPKQVCWLSQERCVERLLLGREAMALHGFPIGKMSAWCDEVGEPVCKQLGGDMMTLPVVLAILSSIVAALSWRAAPYTSGPASLEEINFAQQLLGAATGSSNNSDSESGLGAASGLDLGCRKRGAEGVDDVVRSRARFDYDSPEGRAIGLSRLMHLHKQGVDLCGLPPAML